MSKGYRCIYPYKVLNSINQSRYNTSKEKTLNFFYSTLRFHPVAPDVETTVSFGRIMVATKPDHNPTKKQPPIKMDFSVFLEFKTNFKSFFSILILLFG